jgi:hypothetical protein
MKRRKIVSVVALLVVTALLLPLTACTDFVEKIQYAVISENNISDDGLIYSVYENKTAEPSFDDGAYVSAVMDAALRSDASGNECLVKWEI